MVTKVQKWGNSQGLRVSREVLSEAHISVGDEVQVTVKHGAIIVKPAVKIRGAYDLKELVSKMPKGYEPYEEDWGPPVGKEIW